MLFNLFLILLDELLDLSPPPARRSARAPNGLRADVPPAPDRLPVPITRGLWRFIYLPYLWWLFGSGYPGCELCVEFPFVEVMFLEVEMIFKVFFAKIFASENTDFLKGRGFNISTSSQRRETGLSAFMQHAAVI